MIVQKNDIPIICQYKPIVKKSNNKEADGNSAYEYRLIFG
jgi:hypothetical protein